MQHKFRVGQLVRLHSDASITASGLYEVVRLLPSTANGELQYRLRGVHEPHERIAAQHRLSSATNPSPAALPRGAQDAAARRSET
jgi:hypothetical protein